MTRQEQARSLMRAQPGRDWKAVELSILLNCAPSMARAALDAMVQAGEAVKNPATDTYVMTDVRAQIRQFLADHPHQEYTAIGIVEALPTLHLTESRACRLLHELELRGHALSFYSFYTEVES